MKVGLIRVEGMAGERMEALRRLEKDPSSRLVEALVEQVYREADLLASNFMDRFSGFLEGRQVVFIAVPGAYAFRLAAASLRHGVHSFLGRSAVPSLNESNTLATLGEEAGVETGISRINRFHPFLNNVPAEWQTSLISLQHDTESQSPQGFQGMLEDAADLCCYLAGRGEARKIEARLSQFDAVLPASMMIGIRFQNGTYAQIQLRQGRPCARHIVYISGGGVDIEADLANFTVEKRVFIDRENDTNETAFESEPIDRQNLIELETIAFLEAVVGNKPAPISIMDGLHTLRLIEGIRSNLR